MVMSIAASPSAEPPHALGPATSSTVNSSPVPLSKALPIPSTFTNKQWIVPPRPKPGRKPAADTPPSKRKAQNRAAQRAFRERRAARVGELEEEMRLMEEKDFEEQEQLRQQIGQLESDIESYRQALTSWQETMKGMQEEVERERQLRESSQRELEALRAEKSASTDPVPLPSRRSTRLRQDGAQERPHVPPSFSDDIPLGCGNCTKTRCECIEAALDLDPISTDTSTQKRPTSPQASTDNKRRRSDDQYDARHDMEETEIDFTNQFSSNRPPLPTSTSTMTSTIPATAVSVDCGFCSDGTPCICAEIEAEKKRHDQPFKISEPSRANPCVNGPGTCAQCQSNPTSTLFCKSLAATRTSILPKPAPTSNLPTRPNSHSAQLDAKSMHNTSSNTGGTLSCADAFTTLSRHPAFDRATGDLGSWVPQLATVPDGPGGIQRTPFEIEIASVMGVLKVFDRRFGGDVDNGRG